MKNRSVQVTPRQWNRKADQRPGRMLIIGVVAALALAACGSDSKSTSTTAAPTTAAAAPISTGAASTVPAASAPHGAVPVTITHKYGDTVVLEQPTKVISVGFSDQDAILGLGVKPIVFFVL